MKKMDFLEFCNNTQYLTEKLTEENILTIFDEYDHSKENIYAKIFNDLSRDEINNILLENNIEKEKIINIYNSLRKNSPYFLKYYNY